MKTPGQAEFDKLFVRRTAELRGAAKLTQDQMAALLDIDRDTYKQWEIRNPMPHYLIPRFCIAARTEPSSLFHVRQRSFRAAS